MTPISTDWSEGALPPRRGRGEAAPAPLPRSPSARPRASRAVGTVIVLSLIVSACGAKRSPESLGPLGIAPEPPQISLTEVPQHSGELVTVDTTIASAHVADGQAVLVPAGADPDGLVIAIAPPLVGPSAEELVGRFSGQRVRAIGRVSDLGGRLEILVGDPRRVQVLDATGAVVRPATPAAPPPPAAPAAASAPTTSAPAAAPAPAAPAAPAPAPTAPPVVAPAAPPPVVPAPPPAAAAPAPAAPAGVVPAPAAPPQDDESRRACESARRVWQEAAAAAKAPLAELQKCLASGDPPCTRESARARIAMAEVAASEERVRWLCGSAQ